MALISLICLLALSSSAFGRTTFDSYSARDVLPRTLASPVQSGYGSSHAVQQLPMQNVLQTEQQLIAPLKTNVQLRGYGSGYQQQQQFADQPTLPIVVQPTEADILCRSKRPETIIPLEDGRRFVVCLDDGKGEEQKCPKGLLFHPESRRCERRLGPLENLCSSQPCLNNGQCLPIDTSSFQCKCAPGFDGTICELDARVCQTQQPCGQAQGTRCQSFRASAALSYICIHQNELAYGFSAQQVQPSPCRGVDGAVPLPITDKAFAMCDGERMFIESCPGGTLWDDITKACVWPDMRGVITTLPVNEQPKSIGYGQQTLVPQSSYGSQSLIQQQPILKQQDFQKSIELPIQSTSSYGEQQIFQQQPIQRQLDVQTSSYGSQQLPIQRQQLVQQQQQPMQRQMELQTSSYGSQQVQQQPIQRQLDLQTSSYGGQQVQQQQPIQRQLDLQTSSYGGQQVQQQQQQPIQRQLDLQTSSYGGQQVQQQQQPIQRQLDLQTSSYGGQQVQQQQQPIQRQLDLQTSSYGGQQVQQQQQPIQRQLDLQTSSYGSQQVQQQPIQQTFQQPMQKLQQDFRPVQQTSSY